MLYTATNTLYNYNYNICLKKQNKTLTFSVNDVPVYTTTHLIDDTWNHITWNIIDTNTNQGYVRINNGVKNTYNQILLTQPVFMLFPPSAMRADNTVLNGITYRACAYDYVDDNYQPFLAFTRDATGTNAWISPTSHFLSSTGVMNIIGYSFGNDTSFKGAYLGIDMGQKIVMKAYKITRVNSTWAERIPRTWKIYATNDDRCWNPTGGKYNRMPAFNTGPEFGWVEIDYELNQTTYTDDTFFNLPNNALGFRYYAINVNSIRGGTSSTNSLLIGEWYIYGYPYYTFVNRLGAITNQGSLYLSDLRLDTNALTTEYENNIYDKYALINNQGTYIFSSNTNKVISLSKEELELNELSHSTITNLSISTWFKTENFADNDVIFELNQDFLTDTTNLYFWYKFNTSEFFKNFGIAGAAYDLQPSNADNTLVQTTDRVVGDASVNFTSANGNLLTNAYNFATNFTNACTISFWLKRKSLNTSFDVILYAYNTSTGLYDSSFIIQRNSTTSSWQIYLFGNNGTSGALLNDFTADDTWNHYAFIAEKSGTATKLSVYKNGTFVYTNTSGTWSAPNRGFALSGDDVSNRMIGNLDDIRIYNRKLSVDEIKYLYNNLSYESENSKVNLIAWYKFDTDASDFSGNNNELTNYSCTFNHSDFRIGNGSVQFNGSSYLEIANDGRFSPDNFTISCWCKLVQTAANTFATIAMCRHENTNVYGWNIYIYNNHLQFWTGGGGGLGTWNGSGQELYNNFAASTPTWRHLVITVNKSSSISTIYVDGVFIGTYTRNYDNSSLSPLFTIGAGRYLFGDAFAMLPNGSLIDDFRIYSRVLTADEIYSLYINRATNNLIVKKNNNELSCQLNNVTVYEAPYLDNKWNYILLNVSNTSSSLCFIQVNNGRKHYFDKVSFNRTIKPKLAARENTGDLHVYNWKMITTALTSESESQLYDTFFITNNEYGTQYMNVNSVYMYSDKIKIHNDDYISDVQEIDLKKTSITDDTVNIVDYNKNALMIKNKYTSYQSDVGIDNNYLTMSGCFKSDAKQECDEIILNMSLDTISTNNFFSDTNNLYFWYKFNSIDFYRNYGLTGRDYDLIPTTTLIYPQKTDKVFGDASANFTASSGYLSTSQYNFATHFSTAFTLCFWIERRGLNTNSDIQFYGWLNSALNTSLVIQRSSTNNFMNVNLFGNNITTNTFLNDYKADNSWSHYVFMAERSGTATKISVYKNGIFVFTNTGGTWTIPNMGFIISGNSSTTTMIGNLDDFRIYNKTLTQDEINALYYNNSFYTQTANIVAWYKFADATNMLADSSGNNNMLTNSNGIVFDIQNYKLGTGSVFFDTTAKWLNMPSSINAYTIANANGITFSFWTKASISTTANGRIFEISDNAVDVAPTNSIIVQRSASKGTLLFSINASNYETINNYIDDNWHHFVWCISSTGTWTLYVDGVNQNLSITQAIPNATWVKRYIGRGWSVSTLYSGNIDDFRIYNRVLTAYEAHILYSTNSNLGNNYVIRRTNDILSFNVNNIPVYTTPYTNDTWRQFLWNIQNNNSKAFIQLDGRGKYYYQSVATVHNTILKYPPSPMTSLNTVLNVFGVNHGNYVCSASSTLNSTEAAFNAFNYNNTSTATNNIWTSDLVWNGSTGAYTGIVTTMVSGVAYSGEWLQLQIPLAIVLKYYFIYVHEATRWPKNFILAGSNNGTTWELIDNQSNTTVFHTTTGCMFNLRNNTKSFSYYRIIVLGIVGSLYLSITEWELYGYPSLLYTYNFGSDNNQGLTYISNFSVMTNPLTPSLENQINSYMSEYKKIATMKKVDDKIKKMNSLYYKGSKKIEANVNGGSVYGTLTATGSVSSFYSDMRLKDIVEEIEYPLEKVRKLQAFKYVPSELAKSLNFIDDIHAVNVGVNAQDVQQVLPEAVELAPFDSSNLPNGEIISKSGHNFLSVSYESIVPLLIECTKELKRKFDDMKCKN
jgi:hypothetical protein